MNNLGAFTASYSAIHSFAVGEKSTGPASGGLVTYVKKNLKYKLLDKSLWWIFVFVFSENIKFVVCSLYFNFAHALNEFIQLFDNLI